MGFDCDAIQLKEDAPDPMVDRSCRGMFLAQGAVFTFATHQNQAKLHVVAWTS